MGIVREKIKQANRLLEEMKIDLWLVAVRETPVMADPVLPMVIGNDVTWESYFFFTADGQAIALVGNLDVENFRGQGCFTEVITYTQGVGEDFRSVITRLDPNRIAINYSQDNPAADGLTYGMYRTLLSHLEGTPYADRLVSAEEVCTLLRSRKLDIETGLLEHAAVLADQAFQATLDTIQVGMTEKEIAALVDHEVAELGAAISFDTIVNAGDKTQPGHGRPTDARLEPGDLLHVDFGARVDGYCSDLQRLVYFRRPGESGPPDVLAEAFESVRDIITETAAVARPGRQGHEIDAVARNMLTERGYPEYQHALGHQLGRAVHDGGALIGPKWERYGRAPMRVLEASNVFTLELEVILPGIGCVGLEENVCITDSGARFLCPRQLELMVR